MTHGLYRVVGTREYRGHKPGEEFEAQLDPRAEQRAIYRGDIELIERVTPSIRPGALRLPPGWAGTDTPTKAPLGASLIGGGG